MTDDLGRWIAARVDEDAELPPEVGLLVLAALESDEALHEQLSEGGHEARPGGQAAAAVDQSEPPGAFLSSLQVKGFRGIGEAVTIDFSPQPGLTIVAGRNGSGKSSVAEALELALTGSTYRWKKKPVQWKESWRNLHHGSGALVRATIAEEGRGETTIGVDWPDDSVDVGAAETWVQRAGAKREPGLGALGWEAALDTYRPLMSYDELGGMLEAGPSALYDALAKALGVEQITDAIRRLDVQHKKLKEPGDELGKRRRLLREQAEAIADERAEQVATLLRKKSPDITALREVAIGVTTPDAGVLVDLRAVQSLAVPARDEVERVVSKLRGAVQRMSEAGEDHLARDRARLDVRIAALKVHEDHGDMSCPVCNQGELDTVWAATSRDLVRKRTEDLEDLDAARRELEAARAAVRTLVRPRPPALDHEPLPELTAQTRAARDAWDEWSALPSGDLPMADHLETRWLSLDEALPPLLSAAAEELQRRQDVWSPLATQVAGFCDDWDAWETSRESVENLGAATKWLKDNDVRLKNERLVPIGDRARAAWAMLRQESNVDLGALTLEGSNTRRRVSIPATVDGEDAGALAVMSQGELHALSLALFLPRASMPESPFRFLVLDDPVQAMDPAKVDGLVQLLSELATTRQVIVLSHDDRLSAAARRARVGATILEVARGSTSAVKVTRSLDPAQRYLEDARALTYDEDLPEETLRRTVPSMLRFAVEAAARDVVFDRRLTHGEALADIEALWSGHRTTRARVSLAIYDDVRNLDGWLARRHRSVGLGIATSGAHEGLRSVDDAKDACRDVEKLVKDLRDGVKQ